MRYEHIIDVMWRLYLPAAANMFPQLDAIMIAMSRQQRHLDIRPHTVTPSQCSVVKKKPPRSFSIIIVTYARENKTSVLVLCPHMLATRHAPLEEYTHEVLSADAFGKAFKATAAFA